ncbi:MAG: hypothetical protein ACLQM8_02790 [Limisphaerales bacterium]
MMDPPQKPFDNVVFRARGSRCLAASVAPPFRAAHWPDIAVLAGELKLPAFVAASLDEPESQRTLLSALAGGAARGAAFWPARIGFASGPEDIQRPEAYRRSRRSVVFLGECSRDVTLSALEAATQGIGPRGVVDVGLKGWDALANWAVGRERIEDIIGYLYHNRRCGCALTVFSELREVDPGLWEFIYQRPRVRVAWVAEDLLRCGSIEEFHQYRPESPALSNLESLGEAGLWPHVVLPVSQANIRALPDLVLALIEGTRGASVEITPVSLVPTRPDLANLPVPEGPGKFPLTPPARTKPLRRGEGPALSPGGLSRMGGDEGNSPEAKARPGPSERARASHWEQQERTNWNGDDADPACVEEYVEALMEIYRNPQVPLRLVSPLSWVAARIDAQAPLVSSPAAAGAEFAVLPNGDVYAGESAAGLEQWRLGSALKDGADLRWERLDATTEMSCYSLKPPECAGCDWRYRCGGLDPSILQLEERVGPNRTNGGPSLRELYCAPRKRLFEELLWASLEAAAQGQEPGGRERLSLREDGLDFEPVKNDH